MTTTVAPPTDTGPRPSGVLERLGPELVAGTLVSLVVLQPVLADALDVPLLQTWSTMFVSVTVQAMPFLTLGVLISAVIAAGVPAERLARALPRQPALAVVGASGAGILLPGCECGSVPISGRLVARGVAPAAALAFMLAAPAINPVVLVSTAVAFPGAPEMVLARFLASLATAILVGLVWLRVGDPERLVERARARVTEGETRLATFAATFRHDLLHAGGYLVVGSAVAATLQTLVPRTVVDSVAGSGLLAVLVMATLAIVLSICSEADAFVAAGLSQFSLTSRLVFLVVGPAVDLKLVALQAGVFGRDFAMRFAPTTVVVATVAAVLVGGWVL